MPDAKLQPPSPEELAAIVAAVEIVWPRPLPAAAPSQSPWRFSGRWWRGSAVARRPRPRGTWMTR